MTLGIKSKEQNSYSKDVTNISYNKELINDNLKPNLILIESVDTTHTYTIAINTIASHNGVPEARKDEFARAIIALAKDTCLSTPRLLPMVLGNKQAEKPGTVVTEAASFPALDFPKVAPEKWRTPGKGYKYQKGDETPEDFAVRVYGQWMKPDNTGISMAEILNLDESLWNALRRSPRTEKPDGFCLPSKKERGDALVSLVASGTVAPPNDFRGSSRLVALARLRGLNLADRR